MIQKTGLMIQAKAARLKKTDPELKNFVFVIPAKIALHPAGRQ